MNYAYYQIDTETIFAVGKTKNELETDLMKNNNMNDIDIDTLTIISISQNDYERIINKGCVNLKDSYTILN